MCGKYLQDGGNHLQHFFMYAQGQSESNAVCMVSSFIIFLWQ